MSDDPVPQPTEASSQAAPQIPCYRDTKVALTNIHLKQIHLKTLLQRFFFLIPGLHLYLAEQMFSFKQIIYKQMLNALSLGKE